MSNVRPHKNLFTHHASHNCNDKASPMKALAIVTLAFALPGCTTVPVPINAAATAPDEQVLNKIPVTSQAPARITVIRDRAFFAGSVVSFFFEVNGVTVVQLRTGEKFTFPVDPGEMFLSVRTNAIGATNKPLQIQTTLYPSKHYVYRVGNDSNWIPSIARDLELSDK